MFMPQAGRRRGVQSLLVDPYRQVKLGLLFLVLNCVFAVLILGVFGYYVLDIYKAVSLYFQLSNQESQLALQKFFWPLAVVFGLIALFVLSTLYISVKYTHQIYGPLVSIHRFLDELLAGRRPAELSLRESDQLQDLAEKLNKVASLVEGR